MTCEMCYRECVGTECDECRDHRIYWEGLSPAEKASELRAMELHVLEWERMGLEDNG